MEGLCIIHHCALYISNYGIYKWVDSVIMVFTSEWDIFKIIILKQGTTTTEK